MSKKLNVFEVSEKRIEFIFREFENIYLSFSGWKDSWVMLNLVIDYMKKNNINKKIGVLIVDLEAQYRLTVDFIKEMVENHKQYIELYWCCLPLNLRNSVSNFEPFWTCWDAEKKEWWVREMPICAINEWNHNFDFFQNWMEFEEFIPQFGKWFQKEKWGWKTACLIWIRTQESLNRWRTINSENKKTYKNKNWTTENWKDFYNCYPIFDWKTEDIWIWNWKKWWLYNKLYDYMHFSGLSIHKMRVCQPYGDDQRIGLNLYKIIEPETWERVVNRVNWVNFGNIYCGTKAIWFHQIKKPKNHSWESYTKFLLSTLPEKLKNHYLEKFNTFIKYWKNDWCPIMEKDYQNIPKQFAKLSEKTSTRWKQDKKLLVYFKIPDELKWDFESKRLAPSWRRMAYAIIKNDVLCKTLWFSQTKKQKELKNTLIKSLKN